MDGNEFSWLDVVWSDDLNLIFMDECDTIAGMRGTGS